MIFPYADMSSFFLTNQGYISCEMLAEWNEDTNPNF